MIRPAIELALSGVLLLTGLLVLRVGFSRDLQRSTCCYQLGFPTNLESEAVSRFLAALSGLLPPWWKRWLVRAEVVLETVSTTNGINHYLMVPESVSGVITSALTAQLPSVRYELLAAPLTHRTTIGAEYRLSTQGRSLRTDPVGLSSGLLSSLWPLNSGEQIVVQWALTPAAPVQPARLQAKGQTPIVNLDGGTLLDNPEAVSALKAKQAEPLLLAIGRIAVRAAASERARSLLRRAESSWHASRAPGVHLTRRLARERMAARRLNHRALPILRMPMLLNTIEASGLIGWPVGISALPGLMLGGCRLLPVAQAIPASGTVLGTSTFPSSRGRAVAMDHDARRRHLWVCGPTGIGKTTLLARMALSDIGQGRPTIVIDPKGELIERIAERLPEHRLDQTIILDASDDGRPVGYNPLKCTPDSRELAVEQVLGVMRAIWHTSWGPRLDDIVRGCLLTLTANGGQATLAELPVLLTDEAFRGRLLSKLRDPFGVEPFWATFNSWSKAEQITNTAPVLNKARAFAMRSRLRGVLGQANPAVDLSRIIQRRQVLLVNLASGKLGTEMAYLLGSLIFAGVWDAVSARASLPEKRRSVVACYLDEFQHLVTLPTPAETVLAEGRSYGLALTLAHQQLGQLDRDLLAAVKANARSKLVFATSRDDAGVFARELGGGLTPEDMMGIAAYEAVVACFAAGRTQPPATIALPDLDPPLRLAADVLVRSRQRYGVERHDVDAALEARLRGRASPAPMGRTRRARP